MSEGRICDHCGVAEKGDDPSGWVSVETLGPGPDDNVWDLCPECYVAFKKWVGHDKESA